MYMSHVEILCLNCRRDFNLTILFYLLSCLRDSSEAQPILFPHNLEYIVLVSIWYFSSGLFWWFSSKESVCHCRFRFYSCVAKWPQRRKCQLILLFLLGKWHGQRTLVNDRVGHDLGIKQQQFFFCFLPLTHFNQVLTLLYSVLELFL